MEPDDLYPTDADVDHEPAGDAGAADLDEEIHRQQHHQDDPPDPTATVFRSGS